MNLKLLLVFTFCLTTLVADDGIQFFETKVRPIFAEHCYKCHGEKKHKGGLSLNSVEGILAGGETEKLFISGQPDNSFIIEAVKRLDEDFEMPPKNPLPKDKVKTLETWIRMGAPMSAATRPVKLNSSYDWQEELKFWSFQKPVKADIPNENINAIDSFINEDLQKHKLKAMPRASKTALIRRLSYDLVGLPPTPEEVDKFLIDTSENAFEKMVDYYLNSKHFGERWGRHWLDVARYGDDQPYAFAQKSLKNAWKYRDWIVNAFNDDLSYKEFIRRQLAADLIDGLPPEEHAATGLISTGPMYFKRTEVLKALADELDDRVDVVTKGFLGLTVSCARCHNHKYDPIPTKDYYSLAGVFKSTRIYDRFVADDETIEAYYKAVFDKETLRNELQELQVKSLSKDTLKLHEQVYLAAKSIKSGVELKSKSTYIQKWISFLKRKDEKAPTELKNLRHFLASANTESGSIELDDRVAIKNGSWTESKHYKGFIGKGYLHDGNKNKGKSSLTFKLPVSKSSKYQLLLAYNSNSGRAKNISVEVHSGGKKSIVTIDQTKQPVYKSRYVSLGLHEFKSVDDAKVVISNEGTSGYVIVDAVKMIPHGMITNVNESLLRKYVNAYTKKVSDLSSQVSSMNVPIPVFSTADVDQRSPDHRAPINVDLTGFKDLHILIESKVKNKFKFHYNALLNPELISTKKKMFLTDLEPAEVYTEGELYGAKYDTGEDAIICNGEVLRHGIQNIGTTYLRYTLPKGENWKEFIAEGGIFNKAGNQTRNNIARFHVFKESPLKWLERQKSINKLVELTGGMFLNDSRSVSENLTTIDASKYTQLQKQLKSLNLKRPKTVHGLWEGHIRDLKVNVRGNPKKFGDTAPRSYLSILSNGEPIQFSEGSGRLELANLIASEENPLTARVLVNRVWRHLLGRGIVTSPSNFGIVGDKPSNQQLLDWLAVDFMENNWSVKSVIKKIALSEAYQRSSKRNPANEKLDGDNKYFWRQNLRRLDSESLRDGILSVSGKLSLKMGGSPSSEKFDSASFNRRILYAKVSRTAPDKMRAVFDFPAASNSIPKRNETTVPQQKLFYLNSSFIQSMATNLSQRIHSFDSSPKKRLNYTYKLLYGRFPTEAEKQRLLPIMSADEETRKLLAQALLISNEFSYID
ncbi:MAG: DUF1553 domain-containing protein [Lentisphaeraceae bacterium]|nr:DUF1553 domain-containing protein [Lentisphaeraceae bacterium]